MSRNFKMPERRAALFAGLAEFSKGKELGSGAFASVAEATHKATGQKYALKQINLALLSSMDQENVEKELDIHSRLSHRHIVRLFDFFREENVVYLVLELCPGGNLFRFMNRKRLSPDEVRRFFAQTSEAIAYMHKQGFIMRDLKPENLLLDKGLNIRLCDLGWAAALSDTAYCRVKAGTYAYMSPESLQGLPQNEKTDVWALGILLFELSYNKEPYSGTSCNDQMRRIKAAPLELKPTITAEARSLISELLRFEAKERPEARKIFESAYITGRASTREAAHSQPPPPSSSNRHPTLPGQAKPTYESQKTNLLDKQAYNSSKIARPPLTPDSAKLQSTGGLSTPQTQQAPQTPQTQASKPQLYQSRQVEGARPQGLALVGIRQKTTNSDPKRGAFDGLMGTLPSPFSVPAKPEPSDDFFKDTAADVHNFLTQRTTGRESADVPSRSPAFNGRNRQAQHASVDRGRVLVNLGAGSGTNLVRLDSSLSRLQTGANETASNFDALSINHDLYRKARRADNQSVTTIHLPKPNGRNSQADNMSDNRSVSPSFPGPTTGGRPNGVFFGGPDGRATARDESLSRRIISYPARNANNLYGPDARSRSQVNSAQHLVLGSPHGAGLPRDLATPPSSFQSLPRPNAFSSHNIYGGTSGGPGPSGYRISDLRPEEIFASGARQTPQANIYGRPPPPKPRPHNSYESNPRPN